MIVRDLLEAADYKEVAQAYMRQFPPLGERKYNAAAVEETLRDFAKMLCTLEPSPTERCIMVAVPTLCDGSEFVDASLYKIHEIAESVIPLGRELNVYPSSTLEEAKAALDAVAECMPDLTCYGFEFEPWEKTLGAAFLPDNCEASGEAGFVATILYEMSFNGMTREAQDERRGELEKSIAEFDRLKELPKDEQEKHFVSGEDLFGLFEEYGITDNRTEEEKEEDKRVMYVECAINRIRLHAVLRGVRKALCEG